MVVIIVLCGKDYWFMLADNSRSDVSIEYTRDLGQLCNDRLNIIFLSFFYILLFTPLTEKVMTGYPFFCRLL